MLLCWIHVLEPAIFAWSPCVPYSQSLSCVWLFATHWTAALQAPLSTEFTRQESWNRLPSPTPEDLPDTGIKPMSSLLAGNYWPQGQLGSLLYTLPCHLHTVAILPFPFQFWYILFLFLVWLLRLGLPILCWLEVVTVGILVLF